MTIVRLLSTYEANFRTIISEGRILGLLLLIGVIYDLAIYSCI